MEKTFNIYGSIVETEAEKLTFEDVCPQDVKDFIQGIDVADEITININSYGGSVTSGLAICNMLKQASAEGHRTTAHVIGIAASMASAVACACDELKIDSNAFMMVHNPWTFAQGDADDMRKQAEVLDQMRDALVSIYRTKFDAGDETIKKMLDDETWILGSQAPMFNLKCDVIPNEEPLKIAAFAGKNIPKFMHAPKAFEEIIMKKKADIEQANDAMEDVETSSTEVVETKAEEMQTKEPVIEEPEIVEADTQPMAQPEVVTKAEADKRVSGMQSAMAKQMDALKKEYEGKIQDFQVQIKAKDEELTKVKAEVTSLTANLKKTQEELSNMTSALKEKADALDALNGSVNTPAEKTNWKSLKGKAFFDWYAKNH